MDRIFTTGIDQDIESWIEPEKIYYDLEDISAYSMDIKAKRKTRCYGIDAYRVARGESGAP